MRIRSSPWTRSPEVELQRAARATGTAPSLTQAMSKSWKNEPARGPFWTRYFGGKIAFNISRADGNGVPNRVRGRPGDIAESGAFAVRAPEKHACNSVQMPRSPYGDARPGARI